MQNQCWGHNLANKNLTENVIAELLTTKLRDLCMLDWLPKWSNISGSPKCFQIFADDLVVNRLVFFPHFLRTIIAIFEEHFPQISFVINNKSCFRA